MLSEKEKRKIIEYNVSAKEEYEKRRLLTDKGYWGYDITRVFRCVECGAWLPSPIIYFYKGQVIAVKCYKCQGVRK